MNRPYFGDNLKVLWEHVPNESVDLIYLDPPFNSNATYNVLFAEKSGEKSSAQITAPMKTEAVSAGFHDSEHFKGEYPRMQIFTIRELLDGAKVRFPQMGMGATFRAAPKKHRGEQQELF